MDTKLIILRGPSGSGKSTIARKLRESSKRKFATIEQDMFRHGMLHDQEDARELSAVMMRDAVVTALSNGYDVIADGIFDIAHSKDMFDQIIEHHPKNNFIYYFNMSLDETLRRHSTRSKKDEFGEQDMRKWYVSASTSGYDFEKEITESMTEAEIVSRILADINN